MASRPRFRDGSAVLGILRCFGTSVRSACSLCLRGLPLVWLGARSRTLTAPWPAASVTWNVAGWFPVLPLVLCRERDWRWSLTVAERP